MAPSIKDAGAAGDVALVKGTLGDVGDACEPWSVREGEVAVGGGTWGDACDACPMRVGNDANICV